MSQSLLFRPVEPRRSPRGAGSNGKTRTRTRLLVALVGAECLVVASPAWAMHIAEGILPASWAILWFAVATPFVAAGIYRVARRKTADPTYLPMLGMLGAAVFVFSCFPIPVPVAGSTAHPAGTGMSAIFLGPLASTVVAFVSLLLQAVFLAHGGLTTLGGNTFSMGILGSFGGFVAFRLGRALNWNLFWSGALAGVTADLVTYFGTALELALALHGDHSVGSVLGQIYLAFLPTQVPLSVLEGIVTGGMLVYVQRHRPDILRRLGVVAG